MTQNQVQLVEKTWAEVAVLDYVTVGSLFYNRLFEIAPELKPMFRSPMAEQSKKLIVMIDYVISRLHKLDTIIDEVSKLAVRHVQYGVQDEHYTIVGRALLWTLEKGLGDSWTEEVKEAWTECYILLSGAMIEAANKSISQRA